MDFNNEFAAKTWDLISKMDSDEAEMFVRFVAYDTLMEDIENNRRTIDRAVSEITQEIRKDLERVEDERTRSFAEAVSKAWATNYEEKYHRPQNRDKSGRWSVTISREKTNVKNKKPGRGDVRVGDFNLTSALNTTGEEMNEFQRRWHQRSDQDMSTTSGMYDRIGAGAHVLNQAGKATGNPKLRLAGEAGEFFGKYGPQAEQIIGPHMRRTAYRYRGTERSPDPQLRAVVQDEIGTIGRHEGLTDNSQFTTAMANTASHRAAVKYLSQRLPSKNLSELQAASGKIPPSEGIMINGDGKVIAQAVGYMDDHYLPFNLKNLKGLQGGSYVRTRSSGGLTTEDIYTGLVAGARSVTVVSRSGVFTVDFEDDFRGGRRYNDKAASMVSRYAKTLDAVKSEKVTSRPMSAAERLQIREEVEDDMRGYRHDEIEEEITRRVKEARANPTISAQEMKEIDRKAVEAASEGGQGPRGQFSEREWARIKDDPKKRILAYRQQMIEDLMLEKQSQKFQLDGEGYAAAMDALREQFPYYIARSEHIHNKDPRARAMGLSGEKDAGYVKPRYNRPEGAKEGYFDTTINGQGKRGADQTNYQNWQVRQKTRAAEVNAEEGTDEKPKTAASKGAALRNAAVQGKAEAGIRQELTALVDETRDVELPEGNQYKLIEQARTPSGLEAILNKPTGVEDLEKAMRQLHARVSADSADWAKEASKSMKTRLDLVDAHRVTLGGDDWDASTYRGGPAPVNPWKFKGDAYLGGQEPGVYQREWDQLDQRMKGSFPDFNGLPADESGLKNMADAFGKAYAVALRAKETDMDETDVMRQLASATAGLNPSAVQLRTWAEHIARKPEAQMRRFGEAVEVLERARRLKAAAGPATKTPQAASAAAVRETGAGDTIRGELVRDTTAEHRSAPPSAESGQNKRKFLSELQNLWGDIDEDSPTNDYLMDIDYGVKHNDISRIHTGLENLKDDDVVLHDRVKKRLVELGLWHG